MSISEDALLSISIRAICERALKERWTSSPGVSAGSNKHDELRLLINSRHPIITVETPEEERDRIVEVFDHMRVDTTDVFGFSLLCKQ